MVQAIELYLDQIDYRVGDTAIHYESRDTSITHTAPFDDAGCMIAANQLKQRRRRTSSA